MKLFHLVSSIVSLAAVASYVNYRYIKMPTTIGLMTVSLAFSIMMIALGQFNIIDMTDITATVRSIEFDDVMLHWLLGFLLFAGALHTDLHGLKKQSVAVGVLATIGVLIGTFVTGTLLWYGVDKIFDIKMPYIYALLFGALISPTDPIATIGILKNIGAPKDLETKIAGESLFNDGVGVVIFMTILGIALGTESASVSGVSTFLLREVLGGVLVGVSIGALGFFMLKSIDEYQVEILITLAVAMGGYSLAEALHVSAPLAIVVAGLLIGNPGRSFAMSKKTIEHLDTFWEFLDERLNEILFILIGLEIIALGLNLEYLIVGGFAIIAVLVGRYLSVVVPMAKMKKNPGDVAVMTWGGLRGGISIALALSLPQSEYRDLIITITYVVVVFSIFVQGNTFGKLVNYYNK